MYTKDKSERISLRLTAAEAAWIKEKAGKSDMTVSQYTRMLLRLVFMQAGVYK